MQFTDEQLAAIEARGENLLLSAAAGSGKTATLVERVMRLTMQGIDIDTMLVVTFTRAAASGMREKLNRAFSESAAKGDERARDQLLRLERASITTIHAFCADFLRENFESADVDPGFTILDEADARAMVDASLDAALERAYENMSPDLIKLDYGRGPGAVKAMAVQLMDFLSSRPDPEAYLADALKGAPDKWKGEMLASAHRSINESLILLRQALLNDIPDHYVAALSADSDALERMSALDDYEELREALADFKLTRPTGRNTGYDKDIIDYTKSLRERAKKHIEDIKLIDHPLAVALNDSMDTLEGARALAAIAMDAETELRAAKAGRGALTYADLERYTLNALENDDVSRAAKERYSCVFVDEYQDTSDIQEAIIRRVAREGALFMVGDVKQSIYRFRQAEPGLFLDKYARYGTGEGGRLLPLTRNFRSDRSILDFTNAVFERLMTGGDSEIEYDELAHLRPGDDSAPPGADVDIHLLSGRGDDDVDSASREGLMIADVIKDLMAKDPTLHFRDFAVLTRQGASAFSAITPMLIDRGIPCYAEGAAGYFDALEIRLTLSLLRIIDNFHSDEDLIAVLRSCVCGLSVEELALIRLIDRDVSYADAVRKYADEQNPLGEKLREFLAMRDSWVLRSGAVGLDELIHAVTDESGLYAYAGVLPGGAQRQANIDLLIYRASNYDRDVSGSLNRFLAFADSLRARGSGDAAHALGENEDVVHLMTVHHSKGLEFPVVIGARLGTMLHKENNSDNMLCHPDLGLGLVRYDPELRSRRSTLSRAAIMERVNREGLAEELRVMYVLFTRAQKKLVLTGTVRDIERSRALWHAAADSPMLAGSLMDMTMSALEKSPDAPYTLTTHEPSEFQISGIAMGKTEIRVDPSLFDPELAAKFAWVYPHKADEDRPLKLTASGLMRGIDGPNNMEILAPRPVFMQAAGMTGAEAGTAFHRCMQLIDIRALDGLSDRPLIDAIRTQLDDMAARQLITKQQCDAVRPSRIAEFFQSPVGLRLRAAADPRRELPFNVLMDSAEVLTPEETHGGTGELLVQGTIDCCFIEDGQWVLLDYKTNRTDDLDALTNHYSGQLKLYAYALEKISGIPVKERILCLISMGLNLNI